MRGDNLADYCSHWLSLEHRRGHHTRDRWVWDSRPDYTSVSTIEFFDIWILTFELCIKIRLLYFDIIDKVHQTDSTNPNNAYMH